MLIIYGVSILFSLASIFYVLKDRKAGIIIYVIITILIVWIVLTTDILTDKAKIHIKIPNVIKKQNSKKNDK